MARWLIVLAACGLTLAAPVAVAQECPEIVAVLPYGNPDVVAVDGPYAYFGIGRGLLVVDQSDPADLRSVARLAMSGTVRGIAVANGRAYVTLGEDGLRVVDLGDPSDPRIVQAVDTPGEAQGVKVAGDMLLVAAGTAGLCAVSLRSDPPLLGCVDTLQDARDVDVAGILAVVADGPGGLVVVNAADPAHMTVLWTAEMDAQAVKAQGDLAFVASGQAGLRVVDVSDPSNPVQVGQLDTPGIAVGLDVANRLVLVADGDLRVVDVSTPTQPVELAVLQPATHHGTPRVSDIAAQGDRLTLATNQGGARFVSISTPSYPQETGRLDLGPAGDLMLSGSLAMVSLGGYSPGPFRGFSAVDLAVPDHPREVGAVQLDDDAVPARAGDLLFLAQGPTLRVLDLSDPANPQEVGSMPLSGWVGSMAAAGPLLHLIENFELHVVDVSVPSAPHEVSVLPENYQMVAATDGFAYAGVDASYWGCIGGSVSVVDMADPSLPAVVGEVGCGRPVEMKVEEGLLLVVGYAGCVASCATDVSVFDLTTPEDPVLASGGWLTDWPSWSCSGASATVHRGLLFASSDFASDVRAINLDDWYPDGMASLALPDPHGVATLGRHLLVADRELGLVVLDTTCVGGMFADGFEAGTTVAWSEAWP